MSEKLSIVRPFGLVGGQYEVSGILAVLAKLNNYLFVAYLVGNLVLALANLQPLYKSPFTFLFVTYCLSISVLVVNRGKEIESDEAKANQEISNSAKIKTELADRFNHFAFETFPNLVSVGKDPQKSTLDFYSCSAWINANVTGKWSVNVSFLPTLELWIFSFEREDDANAFLAIPRAQFDTARPEA